MKKTRIFFAVFAAGVMFAAGAPVLAEEESDSAVLADLSGTVETRASRKAVWNPARQGDILPEGCLVRTGADGQAELFFSNKTKIWLRENSTLEVAARKNLVSDIALLAGKIKVRVPHLKWKERFIVRTDAAVCAVRGTEFVVSAVEAGDLNVDVLYGQVDLRYTVPPEYGQSEVQINQGVRYNIVRRDRDQDRSAARRPARGDEGRRSGTVFIGTDSLLTRDQEVEGVQDWSPGLSPRQRLDMLVSKEGYRMDIRRFVADTDRTQSNIDTLTKQVMEADLEAGRTLRDVNGNLVRVDQRMLRPDDSSIQIINLVKRPDYTSSAGRFSYYGSDIANRLDSFQTLIRFNSALPQSINNWASFFTNNTVRVDHLNVVAANQTTAGSFFVTALLADNKQLADPAASDEMTDYGKIYFGTVDNTGYNALAQGRVVSALSDGSVQNLSGSTVSGLAWAQRPDADGGWNFLNPSNRDTRQYVNFDSDKFMMESAATPYCVGANCGVSANKIWLATNIYVITNSGRVRSVSDFTSDISNIPSLVANTAGQAQLFIKKDNGGRVDNSANGDLTATFSGISVNSMRKNIDIVAIPDIAYQATSKLLPAFLKLNTKKGSSE
ncbi:MAG: FecR family protein [Elusimicrobiaceae bacterium]|nr:FecR family protein [Elusimicrobiaceae bacterium]